jgi:hypothetical protein
MPMTHAPPRQAATFIDEDEQQHTCRAASPMPPAESSGERSSRALAYNVAWIATVSGNSLERLASLGLDAR